MRLYFTAKNHETKSLSVLRQPIKKKRPEDGSKCSQHVLSSEVHCEKAVSLRIENLVFEVRCLNKNI